MAYTGQTIHNPVSGETITFRATSADTGGERLEIDLTLTPDGHVPGTHVHPSQEERFEVVEGTMKFKLGFKTVVAQAGDVVVVPAGSPHRFANAGERDARARVTVTPALENEVRAPFPPAPVVRAVMSPLRWAARRRDAVPSSALRPQVA